MEEPLISFLYRYVQNRTTAEELFSETMSRVVQKIEEFEPRAKLTTWIFTIARNLAMDHLKSARQNTTSTVDFGEEHTENVIYLNDVLTQKGGDPSENVTQRNEEQKIQKLMATLKPELKEPLLLRYYEQMKYREIGNVLDIPKGTAKYRVHKAIKKLEERWEEASESDRQSPPSFEDTK